MECFNSAAIHEQLCYQNKREKIQISVSANKYALSILKCNSVYKKNIVYCKILKNMFRQIDWSNFSYLIVGSVSSELRDLEAKRQRLQSEVSTFTHKIDQLKMDLLRQQTELDRLKLSVEQVTLCVCVGGG